MVDFLPPRLHIKETSSADGIKFSAGDIIHTIYNPEITNPFAKPWV